MKKMFLKKAFTLIELLVVILIIALLITVAAPLFLGQQTKAQNSKTKQELTVVRKTLKAIWTDKETYPTNIGIQNDTDTTTLIGQLKTSEPQYSFAPYTSGNISTNNIISIKRENNNSVSACQKSQSNTYFCLLTSENNSINILTAQTNTFNNKSQAAETSQTRYSTGTTEDDARAALTENGSTGQANKGTNNTGKPSWDTNTQETLAGASAIPPRQNYDTVILAETSLIKYWQLDETSGTTTYPSKGSINGTLYNAPTLGQPPLTYGGSRSMRFNGTNQYISFGQNNNFTGSWTVELWAKPESPTWSVIFGQQQPAGSSPQNMIVAYNGASNSFTAQTSADSFKSISSPSIFPVNNVYHVVGTYNDTTKTLSIFVNGQLQNQTTLTTAPPTLSTLSLYVGALTDGYGNINYLYKGYIDSVALYNTVLSLSTIANHYSVGAI